MRTIKLWGDWKPRWYQLPVLAAFQSGKYDRFFLRWPRRHGKDWTAWRIMVEEAIRRKGNYNYYFPTGKLGREVIFEGISYDGRGYLHDLPKEIIANFDKNESMVKLFNGSTIQVLGTDHCEVVGPNPIGVVMSEYALQNPLGWTLISPILDENGGWAIFATTLRAKNHAHDRWKRSLNAPGWFRQKLTTAMTGVTPMTRILRSLQDGSKTISYTLQEHFASSQAGLEESTYGAELQDVRNQGRMLDLRPVPGQKIYAAFDIGYQDYTAAWIFQYVDGNILILNFYQKKLKSLIHNIGAIDELRPGITTYVMPWEIKRHETFDGLSIEDKLRMFGREVKMVPKTGDIDSDINLVREWFPKVYFSKDAIEGFNTLEQYDSTIHGKRNTKAHSKMPSHCADAFRAMIRALALKLIGLPEIMQEERQDTRDWGGRIKVQEVQRPRARHRALARVGHHKSRTFA